MGSDTIIITLKIPESQSEKITILNVKGNGISKDPDDMNDVEWFVYDWDVYNESLFWAATIHRPEPGIYKFTGKLRCDWFKIQKIERVETWHT